MVGSYVRLNDLCFVVIWEEKKQDIESIKFHVVNQN